MRILCYGDSNTYGYDPRGSFGDRYGAEDRWPDLLSIHTGWEVVNAGVNGREIPRGSHTLRLSNELGNADIILVMLGTNDLLQGASAQEAAARMDAFLNQLLPHFERILLISPPPMKRGVWVSTDALVAESIQLGQEYQALAQKRNIPFADTRDWNIELAFDGVHFTEAGHHCFAAQMKNICSNLFIST